MTRVAWLGEGEALSANTAGGKAASLDWLARNGLRTAPGFCVTLDAYASYVSANGLAESVAALIPKLPDPGARAALEHGTQNHEIPGELASLIARSLDRLAGMTPPGSSLAVRSSAIDEDGHKASFAGQYATVLGVAFDAVEAALRRCWASLWSEQAVSYRVNRGLGFDRAAMGVVVQWLVPADASAVAFTRNPVNGSDDEVLICATNGLGEPLVSGQVTPDTIVIDKDTLSASQVEAGEKGVQLVARGGGVERLAIADDTALALDSRSALALTELCLRVEDLAGEPMDVEAALLGDRWYLLQARPVTASLGT